MVMQRTSAKVQSNHREHENFMAKKHINMCNTAVTKSIQSHNFSHRGAPLTWNFWWLLIGIMRLPLEYQCSLFGFSQFSS